MIVQLYTPKINPELISAAIDGFEEQKKRIDAQIAELRQMLSARSDNAGAALSETRPKRRTLSAAARARIAAAQRKRWAAKRANGAGSEITSAPVRKKRKLSAAGGSRLSRRRNGGGRHANDSWHVVGGYRFLSLLVDRRVLAAKRRFLPQRVRSFSVGTSKRRQ